MPPAGVKKGTKRARQYEHIKDSLEGAGPLRGQGRGDRRAHRQQGARASRRVEDRLEDLDARIRSRRASAAAGARARERAKGRTRDQLYAEAQHKNVKGRSSMNKAQLQRAVGR